MNIFIVTKNRACQLDAVLRSLNDKVRPYIHFDKLIIMYVGETKEHRAAYNKCFSENLPGNNLFKSAILIEEKIKDNFKNYFLYSIQQSEKNTNLLCLTDDTFFWRNAPDLIEAQHFGYDQQILCHSLRLGANTTIQDPAINSKMTHPVKFNQIENFYTWDYFGLGTSQNFGYPISLDGHIYRSEELFDMSKGSPFNNLRSWEGSLINRYLGGSTFFSNRTLMSCNKFSSVVNIPTNVVQERACVASPYEISENEMVEKYLGGFYVDLGETINVIPNGSHQFLEIKFTKSKV